MNLRSNMDKGVFITFEGGEGSGKTTALKKVQTLLEAKGYTLLATRAPGGTTLGIEIREILLHKEAIHLCKKGELFLFLADRAQHTQEVILPALAAGKWVLCDRFNDSTLAYQGAARHGDLNFIEKLCFYAVNDLSPHLTLYLDIDPSLGLQRAKKAISEQGKASYDRIETEKLEFHQRVRECYLKLASLHPSRIVIIDASQPLEKVVEVASETIMQYVENNK